MKRSSRKCSRRCTLDIGEGIGKISVARRTRAGHRPLIGEFSVQIKFKDPKLALSAIKQAEAFFIALQCAGQAWGALDATKTGIVYWLHGNAAHAA